MDRKEFLGSIGLSAATLTVVSCFGCSKSSGNGTNPITSGPSKVNFTLDLNASANAALLINGGYLATNGVLVARTLDGVYLAVQQSCTHQNYSLVYQASQHGFYCNNHGSAFTDAGVVLNSPANSNLTVYKTTLTGTSLAITS